MITFRTITRAEYPLIREIHAAAIEAGEYLTLAPFNTEQTRMDYWFGDKPEGEVWMAEEDGIVLGSYYQRPNHYGYGSHIANGGYIVAPEAKGRGIGRKLGEHSLARAREKGYRGMQYNFVVSTNTIAVNLWKSLGFQIIATLPGGYHRKGQEYVDAYVMFQSFV
jgi:ribosomal protein S18 acetylase RimI-like enzyme